MTQDIPRLVRFTSVGLAEVLQARNQGLKGSITHIGAGTARYDPNGSETALRDERQRVAIIDYEGYSTAPMNTKSVSSASTLPAALCWRCIHKLARC